jgi:hypothetical protein
LLAKAGAHDATARRASSQRLRSPA